eukprot:7388008-Prymnesium_polylepis.3
MPSLPPPWRMYGASLRHQLRPQVRTILPVAELAPDDNRGLSAEELQASAHHQRAHPNTVCTPKQRAQTVCTPKQPNQTAHPQAVHTPGALRRSLFSEYARPQPGAYPTPSLGHTSAPRFALPHPAATRGARLASAAHGAHGVRKPPPALPPPSPPPSPPPLPPPHVTPAEAARAAVEKWRREQQQKRIEAAERRRSLGLSRASKADVMQRMRGVAAAAEAAG